MPASDANRAMTPEPRQHIPPDAAEALMGLIPCAVFVVDAERRVTYWSPGAEDLTGYTAAEAIGKNLRELVKSGQHDQAFYKNLWDTILSGQVWRGEIINRRKDDSLYTEEETITPERWTSHARK